MRTTLIPAMLRSISANISRNAGTVRLFETGRTFRPDETAAMRNPDGSYALSQPCIETETLCIGVVDDDADFFALKGILETLLGRFGIVGAEFKPGAASYYHPGRSATISVGGETAGMLGEIHPDVALAFEIGRRILLVELDIDQVLSRARSDNAIRPLPKFPAISRDVAVTVGKSLPVGGILSAIRIVGGNLLESAGLFDIYEGKQAGEGKKSVAFTLVFRAADHTLVDEEANRCFNAIVDSLQKEFGAEIRK